MTPEKYIQNDICKYLKSLEDKNLPVFWERRQAGGFSYKKGIPDLYAVINGVHVEIEVKAPGGSRSSRQDAFERMCKERSIVYICTDNVEDVKKLVQSLINL